MEYPIRERIEAQLTHLVKNKLWLAEQIGVSDKTIYNWKSIGNISLENILKLSSALEINFLEDYNQWLRDNDEPAVASWKEEEIAYKTTLKNSMTLTFSVRGDTDALSRHFSKLLNTIRAECSVCGLELV